MFPDLADVKDYLGTDHSWSDSEIQAALDSQVGDQTRKCRVPASRSGEVTTTLDSAEVEGSFTSADIGSFITAAGVPDDTTILAVTEDEETEIVTATLSANATASATVTATVYVASLVEALYRRVHVGLSLKPLPLGFQVTLSDVNAATTRVGSPSTDALVRDLELPYRKRFLR